MALSPATLLAALERQIEEILCDGVTDIASEDRRLRRLSLPDLFKQRTALQWEVQRSSGGGGGFFAVRPSRSGNAY